MANPNPNSNSNRNNAETVEGVVELELIARIRLDFRIVPLKGGFSFSRSSARSHIKGAINVAIGMEIARSFRLDEKDMDITFKSTLRKIQKNKHDVEKGYYGGFVFIRDLDFVRLLPGDDLPAKIRYATRSLVDKLQFARMVDVVARTEFQLRPFIKPSEDSQQLIQLLLAAAEDIPQPTIVLKGLPSDFFADHRLMETLRAFFHTLAILKNVDVDADDNTVSLQCVDVDQCSKALTKLCSSSLLINKGNDSRMVDYEMTLKDLPDPDNSQEMFAYDDSASLEKDNNRIVTEQDMQALMTRMAQLEEEVKYLKTKMEASHAC